MNKKYRVVSAVAALGLVAGACGSDDEPAGESASDEPASASSRVSGEITISGSSTVEPISVRVQELFNDRVPDVDITVDGPGTGDGFELFCNGETDISDASRAIKEVEAERCAENGIVLPKVSGIDVCRELRKRSRVPIIMVTAKSSEIDTVVGLEVGADDYITKPYRLRELVARIRAVLRRGEGAGGVELMSGDALAVGGVVLDPHQHRVEVDGVERNLPLKEFELLHLLLANAGRVLPRETLIDRIWGIDYVGDTKTLDVHVKRLRSKIEAEPSSPRRIVTIRGLGYKYNR